LKIKRALISVYNKEGIESFARLLTEFGVEILSSGGTARYLQQHKIPVVQIAEITGFPEILDGRVKTMHPKITGGILALRDNPVHIQQLAEHQIQTIDLVVVNLYPFLQALADGGKDTAEMLELIDIGGPSMIRAAAKNYPYVAVVTSPEQLESVAAEMRQAAGKLSLTLRRDLARKAFEHTAYYDAMIADYFARQAEPETVLPTRLVLPLQRVSNLRYGENPHQQAGFYQTDVTTGIDGITQLQGIELSYNNLLDVDAALRAVTDFPESTVVIVKHTNPCGIGSDADLVAAYQKAFATDPVSAFGGILSVNRILTVSLAEQLKSHFLEVLLAPEYEPVALQLLQAKRKLRILKFQPKNDNKRHVSVRTALNGLLLQQQDDTFWDESKLKVVSWRQPTVAEWQALAFNWRVAKHVKSNAIVFGGQDRTLAIGAGQMSRVDSVELAVHKAKKSGLTLTGSVLASDAFFPFRDGVDAAVQAGATAIVQPGGSIRDDEVIAAANEYGIAMVFTSLRHFRH